MCCTYVEITFRPGRLSVKFTPEPKKKTFNSRAIAFVCLIDGHWCRISYVLNEIPEEIHQTLTTNEILSVKFSWVKYITHWSHSGPGFYAGMDVTKKGYWSSAVVRAGSTQNLINLHSMLQHCFRQILRYKTGFANRTFIWAWHGAIQSSVKFFFHVNSDRLWGDVDYQKWVWHPKKIVARFAHTQPLSDILDPPLNRFQQLLLPDSEKHLRDIYNLYNTTSV